MVFLFADKNKMRLLILQKQLSPGKWQTNRAGKHGQNWWRIKRPLILPKPSFSSRALCIDTENKGLRNKSGKPLCGRRKRYSWRTWEENKKPRSVKVCKSKCVLEKRNEGILLGCVLDWGWQKNSRPGKNEY